MRITLACSKNNKGRVTTRQVRSEIRKLAGPHHAGASNWDFLSSIIRSPEQPVV